MTIPLVTPKTIKISARGHLLNGYAVEAIAPGHLLKRQNTSDIAFGKHASSSGASQGLVALEDSDRGYTINDNYALGDYLHVLYLYPGDVFWGWLAVSQSINIGDFLVSAGNGNLKKSGTPPITDGALVAVSLMVETTGSTSTKRIKVEAL